MKEESLLVVLAEPARFRFTMNPDSQWRMALPEAMRKVLRIREEDTSILSIHTRIDETSQRLRHCDSRHGKRSGRDMHPTK